MWLKKVKNKKVQMILIGLVLCVTALLFSMCLGFTMELSTFSKEGINEENCPDTFVLQEGSLNLIESIEDEEVKENIESFVSLEGKVISVPIKYDRKDISMFNNMMLSIDKYDEFGYLEIEEGSRNISEGEILIPKTLSNTNNIKIGDSITLEYDKPITLKVVGIYVSTLLPKPIVYTPFIVTNEDIAKLSNESDAALFAVDLKDNSTDNINELSESNKFCVRTLDRETLQNTFTEVSKIIGAIGTLATLVIFVAALVIIRFIIKTNLVKEFKVIGIYKSLGYPAKKIVGFYLKGYLFIGMLFIILGSLLALPLTYKLGTISTEYLEGFKLTSTTYIITIISSIFLVFLLLINVILALSKVKKISPVEAFNIGINLNESNPKSSLIKNAKSPMAMAINEMYKHKKSTILTILILIVSMSLSMLFVKVYYSVDKMVDNSNLWFGTPKNELYVSGNISEDLIDYLEKKDEIKTMVYGDTSYTTEISSNQYNGSLEEVNFNIISNTDEDITKIRIIEGTNPKRKDEIVLGVQLIEKLDLEVGDYLQLNINNKSNEYLITGTFNSMMNNGNDIMITYDAIKEVIPEYKASRCFINLKDKDYYKEFKNDLEEKFTGISVDKKWLAMDNSVEAIQSMLMSISLILVVVFIIFSILNVVIVLLIDNSSKHRKFGILKSLGFTSSYLLRQNLCKYLLMTFLSIIISSVMHLMFSGKICAALVMDAFIDSYLLLGGLLIGFILLIIISIILISLPIKKISPVELMEE